MRCGFGPEDQIKGPHPPCAGEPGQAELVRSKNSGILTGSHFLSAARVGLHHCGFICWVKRHLTAERDGQSQHRATPRPDQAGLTKGTDPRPRCTTARLSATTASVIPRGLSVPSPCPGHTSQPRLPKNMLPREASKTGYHAAFPCGGQHEIQSGQNLRGQTARAI